MNLIKVIKADYIKDYSIFLIFNNGEKKVVDLKNELWGDIFKPLKNKDFFKKFTLNPFTIEWVNGVDFAPEFLYKIGKKLSKNSQLLES